MTAPVLVTGATGFIGGLLTARLLESARRVRAFVRRPPDEQGLRRIIWGPHPPGDAGGEAARRARLEIVHGHLGDAEALARAADGCEIVYHVAGINAMCLRDPAPMYETNVEGTRRVLEASRAAGVRRVVLTSSASTLGGDGRTVMDETAPPPLEVDSHYARSKQLGEQLALEFRGVEVVAVNPSSVQGPGRRGGTARILISYLNGRLPFVLSTRFGLCYTEDCVTGHLLAEVRGRPGQRYVLNTATLTTEEAIDRIGALAGLTERPRILPVNVMMPIALAVELASRAWGRQPPLCREAVRTIARPHLYDGGRAERELGLAYTPLEDALAACVRWYVATGLVKRPLPGRERILARGGITAPRDSNGR